MKRFRALLVFTFVTCGILTALSYDEYSIRVLAPKLLRPNALHVDLNKLTKTSNRTFEKPAAVFLSTIAAAHQRQAADLENKIGRIVLVESELRTKLLLDPLKKSERAAKLKVLAKELLDFKEAQKNQLKSNARLRQFSIRYASHGVTSYNELLAVAATSNLVKPEELGFVASGCEDKVGPMSECSSISQWIAAKPTPTVEDYVGKGRLVYNRINEIWRGGEVVVEAAISANPNMEPVLHLGKVGSIISKKIQTARHISMTLQSSLHLDVEPKNPIKRRIGGNEDAKFKWTVSGLDETEEATLVLSMYLHLDEKDEPLPIKPTYVDTIKVKVSDWMTVTDILSTLDNIWVKLVGAITFVTWLFGTKFRNLFTAGKAPTPTPVQTPRPGGPITSRQLGSKK